MAVEKRLASVEKFCQTFKPRNISSSSSDSSSDDVSFVDTPLSPSVSGAVKRLRFNLAKYCSTSIYPKINRVCIPIFLQLHNNIFLVFLCHVLCLQAVIIVLQGKTASELQKFNFNDYSHVLDFTDIVQTVALYFQSKMSEDYSTIASAPQQIGRGNAICLAMKHANNVHRIVYQLLYGHVYLIWKKFTRYSFPFATNLMLFTIHILSLAALHTIPI